MADKESPWVYLIPAVRLYRRLIAGAYSEIVEPREVSEEVGNTGVQLNDDSI